MALSPSCRVGCLFTCELAQFHLPKRRCDERVIMHSQCKEENVGIGFITMLF